MKSILITTDFSADSRYTLRYVLDLFGDTTKSCRILLLNTYMVQQTDPGQVIMVNDELKRKSKAGLEQEREEALKLLTNPNITIDTASHMGSLNNVVLQLLQKEKIDLVAMGKKAGRHVDMISKMLKQQECPLLITHQKNDS